MPISGAALLGTVEHQLKEKAAEEDRGALRIKISSLRSRSTGSIIRASSSRR
jgi:hypothetical protein